jgi:hypothetical protein
MPPMIIGGISVYEVVAAYRIMIAFIMRNFALSLRRIISSSRR